MVWVGQGKGVVALGLMPRAPALPASTLRYARSPRVAEEYDRTFADTPLFGYDCEVLARWLPEPGRLLDAGCGTGRHVARFAGRGFEVTGVDLSPHMLDVCRAKLKAAGLSARLVQADFTRLDPDEIGEFDSVICMFSALGMIQGYANRVRCLRTLRECVRPGGLLAMHVHNALYDAWRPWGPLWLLGAWLWVGARGMEFGDRIIPNYRDLPSLYIHLFREQELRDALREAGWDLVELIHLNAQRDGPLRGRLARGLRANGFLALAANPRAPAP